MIKVIFNSDCTWIKNCPCLDRPVVSTTGQQVTQQASRVGTILSVFFKALGRCVTCTSGLCAVLVTLWIVFCICCRASSIPHCYTVHQDTFCGGAEFTELQL